MKPTGPSSRYYAFGPFVLDGLRGILWQYGAPVPLTPKVIQMLVALVSRAGELLPKDELIREVWGDTVVEENNLARHVSTIRKALGERPGQREYIVTIPGVGYRFVASVSQLDELPVHYRTAPSRSEPAANNDHVVAPTEIVRPHPSPIKRSNAVAVAALTAGVVAFGTAAVWMVGTRARSGSADVTPTQRSLRQFSYGSGLQQDPTWSPDGLRIAYAADHSGNADLWVQTLGESEPVRLTSSPFNDGQPSWSPSGEEIVFRSERAGGGLYLLSTRGGVEKRLVDFGARPQWSPTGALILFSQAAPDASGSARMYVMSPTGENLRVVSHDDLPSFRVVSAGWHPDGRVSAWGHDERNQLAFVTFPIDGGAAVRSSVADSLAQEVAAAEIELLRFAWAPSGRFLYLEGRTQGVRNLWRVGVDSRTLAWTGPLERLTTGPGGDGGLALSPDGERLVFGSTVSRAGIWSFPFDPVAGRLIGPGAAVTPGDAIENGIDASRDGEKVIYRVLRSDRNELWERSGAADPRLLVSTRDWQYTQPRWAPDGKRVAYQRTRSAREGATAAREISILAVDRQQEQLLAVPAEASVIPADWSSDSSTILAGCRLKPTDAVGTCLLPLDGRALRRVAYEENVDLVQHRFSPDQRWISFSVISLRDRTEARVYVMPVDGGPRIPVTDAGWYDDKPRWAPDGRTLYFVSNRGGRSDVWGRRFDPLRGQPTGDLFRVTSFDQSSRTLISDVGQLSMVVSTRKIFLPMHEATGHVWMLDQVDK